MRDIAVVILVIGCCVAALRTPWHGVLGLALFSYMSPHTFAWGFSRTLPVYATVLACVFLAYLSAKPQDKQPLPKDWRIPAFYLLWAWFGMTTIFAAVPEAATQKLIDVSKVYLPLILTLTLITDRRKLFYLVAVMAFSFGFVAAKGGFWAIGTGFANRVYGPEGTMYGGNNEFAVVTLVSVPLLILWMRETRNFWVKLLIKIMIPLCLAASISSWSRGALVTLVVLALLLIWHSKRKWLAWPLMAAGVALAVQHLPEEWFGRMSTIQTYEEDRSAMNRIETWGHGINYALRKPLTGAGFDGWRKVSKRDWHSAYVEILAEHGFVAAGLWLSLTVGTLFSLTRLGRLGSKHKELAWVANYSYMLRAAIICYLVGSLFLGTTYWDIIYHLVFISVLVKKFAEEEAAALARSVAPGRGMGAFRGPLVPQPAGTVARGGA